ncbi:MAG TPA: cytochrome C [Desulfuromonadales bacterium]|nr:cytochrome C [Desulfuromonadales bacterium]
MKKGIMMTAAVLAVGLFASAGFAAETGESIFKAKCAACHPGGGNIMKATATLKGIKDAKIITAKIRKGGGGMTAFDAKAVSDADAKLVADYIIKTFKK